MTSANAVAVSAFIEGAPPGELSNIITDIKELITEEPALLQTAKPAFEKYNEEQLTVTKLPGSDRNVLVSAHNSLGNGRYYNVDSQKSFAYDHVTQKASAVQTHSLDTRHGELISALQKSLSVYASEHYPSSTIAIFPTSSDAALAILLVANKYSPANFWNGRFRTSYLYDPASYVLSGTVQCDVHYYEDGNVRLTTKKSLNPTTISPSPSSISSASTASATAVEIVKSIASLEGKYQKDLNHSFAKLSEGEFKALRRQLPVTRQKVEWEKIGGYRLGQDIGGGRLRKA